MAHANYVFTSESVSEGHPDKVCDRISDEIVDLVYREARKGGVDPWSVRVACETLATTNRVVIAGGASARPRAAPFAISATSRTVFTGRPPRSTSSSIPSPPISRKGSTRPMRCVTRTA